MQSAFLTTRCQQFISPLGEPVILRGFGLGGWMNMENFITGHAGNEESQRAALFSVLGEEKFQAFFEGFLNHFFTDADARLLKSLGLNCLRLPVNYRHFESDQAPFQLKADGFRHLDRVVESCARHSIYTIIDLHALPGWQNADWHSDNPTNQILFWQHRHFQDRAVWLWEVLADHYKDNPWVAGYDLINEPDDPSCEMLAPVFARLVKAVRAVDPNHILFIEGNHQGSDFSVFDELYPNTVYSFHDYALIGYAGAGLYPGEYHGQPVNCSTLEADFLSRSAFMRKTQTPMWVGETGPMYEGDLTIDRARLALLRDQIDIYENHQASWSLWTYKDIGLQGLAYLDPHSPWMERLAHYLGKKARLGGDAWGGSEQPVAHLTLPIKETLAQLFPGYTPPPFGLDWQVMRMVRAILFAAPLTLEFAQSFRGITNREIEDLMASFDLENCRVREGMAAILEVATRTKEANH